MKILLLGATGRTGKHILKEAAKRGHTISAIARNPEKLNEYQAEITPGSPYDYEVVEKAIKGCNAVITTLNVSRKSENPWAPLNAPKDLISKSASNALAAMEKEGIKRFVALGAIGAGRSWGKAPAILKTIISMSNLKFAFRDHSKQEDMLEKSAMDYTICRAPMLSMKPNHSGVIATPEGEKPASMVLSRNAAAAFFLDVIEHNEHIRQTIYLSNKPEVKKK
ncbi:MAG: NAD(P)H-binding protein [Bacteroidetes bacterium]|nr:NAD(P)H-binding protein [Bacteroidota bacterium]